MILINVKSDENTELVKFTNSCESQAPPPPHTIDRPLH